MIRRHPFLSTVTGVYLGSLALMTLTPITFENKRSSVVSWLVESFSQFGPTKWISTDGVEFALKVMIFVPLGLLLVLLAGRRKWLFVVFLGVLASCWIELAQDIWIPSRTADARDVFANSAGTIIGALLALAIIAARVRRAKAVRSRAQSPLTPISQSPGTGL